MMNHIFKFQKQELVIITKEMTTKEFTGDVLFKGQDLAKALGYSNHRDAILRHVNTSDKVKIKNKDLLIENLKVNNAGENFITESGMYALILSSELESAKEFKFWVTSEVLPKIRKTGTYSILNKGELKIGDILNKELDSIIDVKIEEKLKGYKVKEVEELMAFYRAHGLTKKESRQLVAKTIRLKSTPENIINGYLQTERDEEIRRNYGQVKAYVRELTKVGYTQQEAWNSYAREVLLKTGYDLVKARGAIRAKGNSKASYLDAAKECGILKDSVSIIKRFANRKVKEKIGTVA